MKAIKTYILAGAAALALSSCDDFLNTLHRQQHGKHLAYNHQHERLQGMLLMPNEDSIMQTQK